LGASVSGIIYLLTGDFTKIVFISIVVALPLSYFLTKNWLESFAFKIDLEIWYFLGAGIIALFIAGLTVSMQAIKAASVNPSKCLRDE
jgi:putative ABC transport system permease protein